MFCLQQNAELENDNGPPVPDDLAPTERIPPVLENEQVEAKHQQQVEENTCKITGSSGTVEKKKRKGKKGREQQQQLLPTKQSDTINSSIRFA